jgi:hypothetical protein
MKKKSGFTNYFEIDNNDTETNNIHRSISVNIIINMTNN